MNKLLFGALAAGCVAGAFLACDGNDGVNGPQGATGNGSPGANGQNGANGANGQNGQNADAGPPIVVSATAKHGLDISPVPLTLTGLSEDQVEQIGLGSYLINAVADCGTCHNSPSSTLPPPFLGGGNVFPVGPGASVAARNLTPDGTTGLKLTEAEFIEVMRTGRDFKVPVTEAGAGATLIVMPWESYRWMSTADLKAIYAYLKAIPAVATANIQDTNRPPTPAPAAFTGSFDDGAVTRTLPPENDGHGNSVPDPGNVLRGIAVDAVDGKAAIASLSAAEVGQYGRGAYLVNAVAACSGCHTNPERTGGKIDVAKFMTGGRIFPTPAPLQRSLGTVRVMSSNLLGPNGFFVTADLPTFLATITQGVHADDPPPQAPLGFPMPARVFKNMALEDLESIYTYLRRVAVAVPGGRADKQIRDAALYCATSTDCPNTQATCDSNECTGKTCGSDADCPACQVCGTGKTCEALKDSDAGAALSACVGAGL